MDLPERLRDLVSELGDSLVQALTYDQHCRELALKIQSEGYDLFLVLEATLALQKREPRPEGQAENSSGEWSELDKSFLKTFRISLD